MNKITRTMKHYTYTFGRMGKPDAEGKASLEIIANHTTFSRLGMREIQKLSKDYNAQLLYTDEKEVRAEMDLQTFLDNADLYEV